MKKRKLDVILDSGAFSSWLQQGAKHPKPQVNLNDYIAYAKEHESLFCAVVGLDVIPGKLGVKRTQTDVEYGAEQSYRNQQKMKDAGLSPIPVFHQGEPFKYLERMLKDGETYIGISPYKDTPVSTTRAWMDECFTALTKSDGRPIVKTHGFAVTHPKLMLRYPYFSVDSTSWSLGAGYGQILMPVYPTRDAPPNYIAPPRRIIMSGIVQGKSALQQYQYETMGENMRAVVDRFLSEECKITAVEARYDTQARRKAFLVYFMGFEEQLPPVKFQNPTNSVHLATDLGMRALKPFKLQIYYATGMRHKKWAEMMTEVGANRRLLSYWELRDISSELVEHFVTTGVLPEGRKVPRSRDLRKNWNRESYRNFRRLALAKRKERADLEEGGTPVGS